MLGKVVFCTGRQGFSLQSSLLPRVANVFWDARTQLVWQYKDLRRELHSCLKGFGVFLFFIQVSSIEHLNCHIALQVCVLGRLSVPQSLTSCAWCPMAWRTSVLFFF